MFESGGRFFLLLAIAGLFLVFAGTALQRTGVYLGDQAVMLSADAAKEEPEPENKGKSSKGSETPLVAVAGAPESYGLGPIRPFKVRSRVEKLALFPCSDCHEDEPANPKERKLTEEHENIKLDHGGGRFWCLTCHGSKTKDTLISLKEQPIDFNRPFLLCGQCHFQRQKDWFAGGHGKRAGKWPNILAVPLTSKGLKVENRAQIGAWQGERVVLVCTECHNSHSPSIKPFRPSPPPGTRLGLPRTNFRHVPGPKIWEEGGRKKGH